MSIEMTMLMYGLVLIGIVLLLDWRTHRRLFELERKVRSMTMPGPVRLTQPIPAPPPIGPFRKCIKCGVRTCREGYDRDDPFLCNTCYELMPDKPWLDIDFLEGECVCGCDGYFSEHKESCEHMAQVRAWRARVLELVASSQGSNPPQPRDSRPETTEAPPKPWVGKTPYPRRPRASYPCDCGATDDGDMHEESCEYMEKVRAWREELLVGDTKEIA